MVALALGLLSPALSPGGGLAKVQFDSSHQWEPALSRLFNPGDGAPDPGEIQKLRDALKRTLKNNQWEGVVAKTVLRDETWVTKEIVPSSEPMEILWGGHYTVVGVQYYSEGEVNLIRGKLMFPDGWITVVDMNSLYTVVDLDRWPQSCGWVPPYTPGTYMAFNDDLPVTAEKNADSKPLAALPRGMLLHVEEVVVDNSKRKLVRGKIAGGGWITIRNLESCEHRAAPLQPPPDPKPGRKGSFLIVGDWGWDPKFHFDVVNRKCQEFIALRMLQKFTELGDVKFIINVGDSFYPNGVSSRDDPQWKSKWSDIYGQKLTEVPWYSVYGNHDYHLDPCACTEDLTQCAQINANISDRKRFYMPSTSYFVEHKEMNLEVLALEFNKIGDPRICHYTPCEDTCKGILWNRYMHGFDIFNHRMDESQAKNMLVFSHYPSDHFANMPQLINKMKGNRRQNIVYMGGHRHATDNTSTFPIWPHQSWVVGGGGGLSCDGNQGFLVGEIDWNDNMHVYPVLVDHQLCCQPRR